MCCYEYPPLGGGGGHVVAGLCRQLAESGHLVDLLSMKYRGLPAAEFAGNFSLRRIPSIRTSKVLSHSPEMISYICAAFPIALMMTSKKKYDLIHAHFIFPDGVLAYMLSKATGLPYIITAHGSDVPGYNPDRFKMLHRLLLPFWRIIVRSSTNIICLSRYLETLVARALPSANVKVIPNGIDPLRFKGEGKRTRKILVVSRMFKRKGIQHLLEAVDGLNLDHEIHIVGDGPYLSDLKRMAKGLGLSPRIRFYGHLENSSEQLIQLFETSSIFVFPSMSENFPMVLLEAMAAGLAIVTTRGTGCQEAVGESARLIDPGDVRGLRATVIELTSDPDLCRSLGRSARQRLEENFSWDTVAAKYVNVYERITGAR